MLCTGVTGRQIGCTDDVSSAIYVSKVQVELVFLILTFDTVSSTFCTLCVNHTLAVISCDRHSDGCCLHCVAARAVRVYPYPRVRVAISRVRVGYG